ncbi:acyltransferase family protein [Janibacter alittae]|uniref:Acyltransferase family protein n=1 Tax=Janibacter alittae TaxID=3115209 RepID=A0ABZ2MKE8_9MICO
MIQPPGTLDDAEAPASHAASPSTPDARPRPAPGHLAGLDGLRALAITAVMIFHLDPDWLPGGFLGVDIFFVISGFLITTLLVRERRDTGRIDLVGFWTRRARRLLPALVVVVPAAILIARTVEADLLVGIRRQTLGALTFSTNWLEIAGGSNYFAATSPQLFMNFWSLAVEEQFYLFWPLAMLVLLTLRHRLGLVEGVIAALVAGIGLTSAILMALTYDPANATRAYYGTDTHLVGLMSGAALAIVWMGPARAYTTTRVWHRHRTRFIAAAAATLVLLLVVAAEDRMWTFRLGIPLVALATGVLLLGAVDRPGRLRETLGLAPFVWIGRRSYGIYLWHWPVIVVIGQGIPTNSGSGAFAWTRILAVVVTLALADLSFRFVEGPVRRLGFRGAARRIGGVLALRSTPGRMTVAAAGTALAVSLTLVLITAPDTSSTQQTIEENQARAAALRARTPAQTVGGASSFAMPKGDEVDVFGDSITVASVPALEYYFPGVQIDARKNRRWTDGLSLVTAAGDTLRRAVVLGLGTNDGTDSETIEKVLDEIGDDHMVVIVTLHADRLSRIDGDNAALQRIVEEHPNVALADWDSAVAAEDLQPDGIHPSLGGAHTYAATIRQAFADLSEQHTGTAVPLKNLPRP